MCVRVRKRERERGKVLSKNTMCFFPGRKAVITKKRQLCLGKVAEFSKASAEMIDQVYTNINKVFLKIGAAVVAQR